MAEPLISRERARELAAKWKTAEGSPLAVYVKTGRIGAGILQECRLLYAGPIAQAERQEVLSLGVYLAARSFEDTARKAARFAR